jgi:hypothetical protein
LNSEDVRELTGKVVKSLRDAMARHDKANA